MSSNIHIKFRCEICEQMTDNPEIIEDGVVCCHLCAERFRGG